MTWAMFRWGSARITRCIDSPHAALAIALLALPTTLVALWVGHAWQPIWVVLSLCGMGVSLRRLRQSGWMVRATRPTNRLLSVRLQFMTHLLPLAVHVALLQWVGLNHFFDEARRVDAVATVGVEWALGFLTVALALLLVVNVLVLCWLFLRFWFRRWRLRLNIQVSTNELDIKWRTVGVSFVLWVGVCFFAAICASAANGLQLVEGLGRRHVQVFTQARYFQEVIRTQYLWRDDAETPKLPASTLLEALPGGKTLPEAVVESRHPTDRWSRSGALPVSDQQTSPGDGWVFDTGLTWASTKSSAAAHIDARPDWLGRVLLVAEGSPAEKAGIKRGDRVVASLPNDPPNSARVQAGAPVFVASSSTRRSGEEPLLVKSDNYIDRPVGRVEFLYDGIALQDYAHHSRRPLNTLRTEPNGVYIPIHEFSPHMIKELRQRLEFAYATHLMSHKSRLLMSDIDTVVIDLRSNRGGDVASVASLVGLVMGPFLGKTKGGSGAGRFIARVEIAPRSTFVWPSARSSATPISGTVMTTQTWAGWTHRNTNVGIYAPAARRIVVLTSPITCSASELFIHGLREQIVAPGEILVIGTRTCGKPYGFPLREYFGVTHHVVSTATVDLATRAIAFTTGLRPDCWASDELNQPTWVIGDSLYMAWIDWLQTSQCGVVPPSR